MSFWTDIRSPLIGGLAGGLVGGPVGMGIGAGGGFLMDNANRDRAKLDAKKQGLLPPDMLDPNSMGALTPELEAKMRENKGVDMLRQRAGQVGASPWLSMQEQKIGAQTAQNVNSARSQAAAGAAQAQSQLAAKSGLSAGAMERLASRGAISGMQGAQAAQFQGGQSRLNAGIEDERNRSQAMMALPGAENQATSIWAGVAGNDLDAKRKAMLQNQEMQGKMYGAQLMSNAALEQAKPKGLLGMGFLGL